ncbi:MAG: hypothetical protein RLZZ480_809 [Candidatus Parcubacteria bacterium]|jgi:hypothetical protein
MIGWVFRTIGIIGLLVSGNFLAAAVCVIALIVASTLEEDGFWRGVISIITILIGIFFLFKVTFFLGIIATIVAIIAALTPHPVPR